MEYFNTEQMSKPSALITIHKAAFIMFVINVLLVKETACV